MGPATAMAVWISILAGFALLWVFRTWQLRRRFDDGEVRLVWVAIAGGGVKVWLAAGQLQYGVPLAGYDDRVFLRQATRLLEGQWLGPYDQLILSKGPFYAFFMALTSSISLPLTLAHNLVYLAAAWLFIRALRPLQVATSVRAGLLLVILLCPVLADTDQFVRAWRQSLWPGLVLLAVAGVVGLALREKESVPQQAGWAALSGGSVGALWLLREEAVWTLPMLALPLLFGMWRSLRGGCPCSRLVLLVVPPVVAGLLVGAVSWKNHQAYGYWGTSELRDEAFVAATSALSRVPPHDLARRIAITREARERIYQVSPAFASLKEEMEHGIGEKFMYVTQISTDIDAVREREIGAGWVMWAIRTAVEKSGYAQDAVSARMFYSRLADEVNTACDAGRLTGCLASRHTLFPPWHSSYPGKIWRASHEAMSLVLSYPFNPEPIASQGKKEDLLWLERITHDRVAPADAEAIAAFRSPLRLAITGGLVAVYRHVMQGLFPVALLVWLFLIGQSVYRQVIRPLVVVGSALVIGIAANVAVVAVVEASSFPAIVPGYLGASVPLAVCFAGVILMELLQGRRLIWGRGQALGVAAA